MPRRCHMSSNCRFLGKLVNFSAWETFIYLAVIIYLVEQFKLWGCSGLKRPQKFERAVRKRLNSFTFVLRQICSLIRTIILC